MIRGVSRVGSPRRGEDRPRPGRQHQHREPCALAAGPGPRPEFRLAVLGRVPVQFPGDGRARGAGPGRQGAGLGRRGPGTQLAGLPAPSRRAPPRAGGNSGGMEAGGVADSLLSGACVLFTLGMFSTGL